MAVIPLDLLPPWMAPKAAVEVPELRAEATVLPFVDPKHPRPEYLEAIQAIRTELAEMHERLLALGFQAALEGPLHHWSESQPEGKVLFYGEDDLTATGDPTLLALADLMQRMADVVAEKSTQCS